MVHPYLKIEGQIQSRGGNRAEVTTTCGRTQVNSPVMNKHVREKSPSFVSASRQVDHRTVARCRHQHRQRNIGIRTRSIFAQKNVSDKHADLDAEKTLSVQLLHLTI